METEKGKFDKIIDILFPLDMSCFFDTLLSTKSCGRSLKLKIKQSGVI